MEQITLPTQGFSGNLCNSIAQLSYKAVDISKFERFANKKLACDWNRWIAVYCKQNATWLKYKVRSLLEMA